MHACSRDLHTRELFSRFPDRLKIPSRDLKKAALAQESSQSWSSPNQDKTAFCLSPPNSCVRSTLLIPFRWLYPHASHPLFVKFARQGKKHHHLPTSTRGKTSAKIKPSFRDTKKKEGSKLMPLPLIGCLSSPCLPLSSPKMRYPPLAFPRLARTIFRISESSKPF